MSDVILYAEDDGFYRGLVEPFLSRHGRVIRATSESEFRGNVDALASSGGLPARLAVMDTSIRWDDGCCEQLPEPPANVNEEGGFVAGARCFDYLRQAEKRLGAGQTPVIFLSVDDIEDIVRDLGAKGYGDVDKSGYQCVRKLAREFEGFPDMLRAMSKAGINR